VKGSRNVLWNLIQKNCELKADAAEASEDYEVLQMGNSSLVAEHNKFCYRCEDLEDELKKARSDLAVSIAALEAQVKFAEAHITEVAAASDKRLCDFKAELIRDLAGLWKLSIHNF
jgi:hypothetical protein